MATSALGIGVDFPGIVFVLHVGMPWAMIDFALTHSRSSRYRHAARHLLECESLASSIPDWGAFEPHAAYAARLTAQHGRKSSFWSLIP